MFGVKILGLLLVSLCTASALECYSCADVDFGPCFDPKLLQAPTSVCTSNANTIPNDLVIAKNSTSPTEKFRCYAVHLTFSVDAKVVEKGCARDELTEDFCRRWRVLGEGIHEVDSCELCDSDLCNSGVSRLKVFVFVFLSLLGVQLIS